MRDFNLMKLRVKPNLDFTKGFIPLLPKNFLQRLLRGQKRPIKRVCNFDNSLHDINSLYDRISLVLDVSLEHVVDSFASWSRPCYDSIAPILDHPVRGDI